MRLFYGVSDIMSQNLSDGLIADLEALQNKYADLFMETSQFVGCVEIFKTSLIMGKYKEIEEEGENEEFS